MQATRPLFYKGFIGRSLDEFKRLSNIAFSLEGIKGAKGPYILHNFGSPASVQDCKVMSDAEIGGKSNANLDFVVSPPPSSGIPRPSPHSPGWARFHGAISTELPKDRPEITRSGYAAFRTRDRPPTVFGKSLWDIDPYVYLALRVKSDGRSYFVNVQTESIIPTDLHQHRLFVKTPGEWETVLIRWNDFVRTNHGFVVEPQTEIMRQKIKSVGVGLTDRIQGPFELCIEKMWATNDDSDAEHVVEVPTAAAREGELKAKEAKGGELKPREEELKSREGKLKTKQGQKISWK